GSFRVTGLIIFGRGRTRVAALACWREGQDVGLWVRLGRRPRAGGFPFGAEAGGAVGLFRRPQAGGGGGLLVAPLGVGGPAPRPDFAVRVLLEPEPAQDAGEPAGVAAAAALVGDAERVHDLAEGGPAVGLGAGGFDREGLGEFVLPDVGYLVLELEEGRLGA